MDSFFDFIEQLRDMESFSFQVGYAAALAAVLAIILVVALVYLVFFKYPRRSPGVTIHGQIGSIFISARAIADLIKSLESEFKDIEIAKVLLLDCKHFNRIEIQVNYALGGESMVQIGPALQARAVDSLRDVFGIEGIREVSVKVRKGVFNESPF